jgi:L-2-hydroxyglutarate oxidase LhgO
MTTPIPSTNDPDVVLVGAGIMSVTLAVILKELGPSLKIEIYEVLGSEAQESTNAWNKPISAAAEEEPSMDAGGCKASRSIRRQDHDRAEHRQVHRR